LIGVYSKNCEQWVVTDLAAALYGLNIVSFYDTMGEENTIFLLNHTEVTTIFCSRDTVGKLLGLSSYGHLKNVVSFHALDPEEEAALAAKGLRFFKFAELLQAESIAPYAEVEPSSCHTINYTSGTTGDPKGTILTHENFVSQVAATMEYSHVQFLISDIHFSYLPLAHVYERAFIYVMTNSGCKIAFSSGDLTRLKDDLALAKPSVLIAVPRVIYRIQGGIKD